MTRLGIRMTQFAVPLSAQSIGPTKWNISTADQHEQIGVLWENKEGRWNYTYRSHKLRRGVFFTSCTQALTALALDEQSHRQQFEFIRTPITLDQPIKQRSGWKPSAWPSGAYSQKRYRHLMTREQRDALVARQRARRALAR